MTYLIKVQQYSIDEYSKAYDKATTSWITIDIEKAKEYFIKKYDDMDVIKHCDDSLSFTKYYRLDAVEDKVYISFSEIEEI